MIITGFIVAAYLLGSICSAILVCKLLHKPDPRTVGSKNPGTTNVLRHGGKFAAGLTLLGDILKGFIPVIAARWYGLPLSWVAGVALAAFLGHLFPIYFRFKGGKGVAITFGIVFGLSLWLGIFAAVTWLIIAFIFRFASLSAIVMMILLPIYCYILNLADYTIPMCILSVLVILAHHENIRRLWRKEEGKIREPD